MSYTLRCLILMGLGFAMNATTTNGAPSEESAYRLREVTVVVPVDADPLVRIAADELRRYAYARTRALPPRETTEPEAGPSIVLRTGPGPRLPTAGPAPEQNHALYFESGRGARQVVHGASPVATLWAAYALIETWGFGFYLGGDTEPRPDAEYRAPLVRRDFVPALSIRGNLPWFNFLNSPTTWNPQDYRTFFEQMVKQKANFIGFHAYDHEPFGGYDITRRRATKGGPLMTTISPHRWWSPPAMATSDFLFGTDLFFNRSEWGCEVGIEDAWTWAPGRAVRLQQQMMADALAFAKRRGLRTCLGWEVTGNPDDPAVREDLRRRLEHTLATYPLDYFWIWQSEFGGVGGRETGTEVPDDVEAAFAYLGPDHNLSEAARITKFIRLTYEILQGYAPDVRLIVSGWGGDQWMKFTSLYPGLDKVVPDDVIFAALDNIDPRIAPTVSEAYGQLKPERERWPIPWYESDGGFTRTDQTGPQPNVKVFEPLLKDIVAKGCQGALGIHWRTRNVQDVAGYLYRFGWDSDLTAEAYLHQYASDHYGPENADEMAKVHSRLEELGPQYVGAAGCIECYTSFTWFYNPADAKAIYPEAPHIGHKPYSAGHLPDESRFDELESLQKRLAKHALETAAAGRRTQAIAYHDLANTIRWVVTRAKVGLAIWNESAPLTASLRRAERLHRDGDAKAAHARATEVLDQLQVYRFDRALRALAWTCRTRGELGMLATANARYGRFYASFVERLARILDRPIPLQPQPVEWQRRGAAPPASVSSYSVMLTPGCIPLGSPLVINVAIEQAERRGAAARLPIVSATIHRVGNDPEQTALHPRATECDGGVCRFIFDPPAEGVWEWKIRFATMDSRESTPFYASEAMTPSGVVVVTPSGQPVPPTYERPERQSQKDPVLQINFDRTADEIGEVIGTVERVDGRIGKALDTRPGGYVRISHEESEAAAFDGPFTISLWAKPEPYDANRAMPVLLSKGDWAGGGWFIQLYRGRIRVGLGRERALDVATLEPGRWSHLVVAHDGREATVFVDGDSVGVFDARRITPSAEPLRIGAYREAEHHEHFHFDGLLDEIRFYNRAVPIEELRPEE